MKNSILDSLPLAERARLQPFLSLVHLKINDPLIEPDQPIESVYFPLDAVASIQAIYAGATETGMIGYEGCVGVSVWLHQQTTPTRIFVQGAGSAFRMSADVFRREIRRTASPLNDLMAQYTHSLLMMTSYTAVCHDVHPLQARLCRWLKMMQNRIRKQEFVMKQEFLAYMLGVSRPTVSLVANSLQRLGWIHYRRGLLTVLQPEALEKGACDCLHLIESLFQPKRRPTPAKDYPSS
ncbi:MAG: Crp/Fnr family transcriptional regulator [Acidobacteriaceae bacterium]